MLDRVGIGVSCPTMNQRQGASGAAVAKYLRYIADHFTDAEGRGDAAFYAPVRKAPPTWHLAWMYEHYATPVRSDGVAKVNVFFTAEQLHRTPSEVLGIADVYEQFDAGHFATLASKPQQRYYVDRLHVALLRCAAHFGWSSDNFVAAYERMIADFDFGFYWQKPRTSPDRKTKVQALVEAPFPGRLSLVFFDSKMREQRRALLCMGALGRGSVEFAFGAIDWVDADTVKVQQANGRDYWLCRTDGSVSFHYPRAETGDPHGEFDLGKMYYEGLWVPQDRERGIKLMEGAAAKGFKHAINFLAAIQS
jgi:hypothetical protein